MYISLSLLFETSTILWNGLNAHQIQYNGLKKVVPIDQASLVQMCWQKKLGQNATEMLKNNINIFWLFPYLERKTTSFHRERGKMLAILKGQIMNSLNNQSKTGLWKWLFLSEYETLVHFPLISQRNAITCHLFCCVNLPRKVRISFQQ